MESLEGTLEGIIDDLNTVVASPERITFQPRQATLSILDTDSKCDKMQRQDLLLCIAI